MPRRSEEEVPDYLTVCLDEIDGAPQGSTGILEREGGSHPPGREERMVHRIVNDTGSDTAGGHLTLGKKGRVEVEGGI